MRLALTVNYNTKDCLEVLSIQVAVPSVNVGDDPELMIGKARSTHAMGSTHSLGIY